MALHRLFISTTFLCLLTVQLSALELDVGDEAGWVVPKEKRDDVYNKWAAKNRFRDGDTIRFKYKKDSVMSVTKEEYEHCKSLHPAFFSNSGKTLFTFDHSGTFYFISGTTGHCEKGQKMIIRVLSNGTHSSPTPVSGGADAAVSSAAMQLVVGVLLVRSVFFFF